MPTKNRKACRGGAAGGEPVGHPKAGALETKELERVAVDTTVQPKAIAHPTDARLMCRAIRKVVALARRESVPMRQSYRRVNGAELMDSFDPRLGRDHAGGRYRRHLR